MNLAKLYTESGRAEQAIDCLNLAIRLGPGTSEAYFDSFSTVPATANKPALR
jgi:hypothetical protein